MGSIVGRGVRVEVALTYGPPVAVQAISLAKTAVLSATGHGILLGGEGYLSEVIGMSNIDGQALYAAAVTTETVDMAGVNSLLYPSFVSGYIVPVLTWGLISKATSYALGGGSAEKLDDTALIDDVKQELAGLLDAQTATINVNAQEVNDVTLQTLEDAAFNQGYCVFRVTFKSGAVRVWRGQPSMPGEDVGKGAIGTGSFTTTVKGKVVKSGLAVVV